MQFSPRYLAVAMMACTLVFAPAVEAKRLGGGSSYGMSRSSSASKSSYSSGSGYNRTSSSRSSNSSSYGSASRSSSSTSLNSSSRSTSSSGSYGHNSSSSTNNNGGYNSKNGRDTNSYANNYGNSNRSSSSKGYSTGAVVAAGVAGAAVGALAANAVAGHAQPHTETANAIPAATPVAPATSTAVTPASPEKSSHAGIWWLIIIMIGAVWFFRRRKKNTASSFNQNTASSKPIAAPALAQDNTNVFGQPVGGISASISGGSPQQPAATLLDGTEHAVFLRQARARFMHLQSMNHHSNVEELRRYFTPDMYHAIRDAVLNNQDLAEFPQLDAEITDHTEENGQFICSVRFSGLVSESVHAPAEPFGETWHFVKQRQGNSDWLVAGIQQD